MAPGGWGTGSSSAARPAAHSASPRAHTVQNLHLQCASLLETFSVSVDTPLTLSVQNTKSVLQAGHFQCKCMRRWPLKVQPHLSELKCAAPGGAAGLVRFAAVGLRGTIPASRHYRVPRSNDRLLFNDLLTLPMNVLIGGQTKHTTSPPYHRGCQTIAWLS